MPFSSAEERREYDLQRRLAKPGLLKIPKARYYASKRGVLRLQNILWRLQHGHGVRQETLDTYGLVLSPGLQHLAHPRASSSQNNNSITQDGFYSRPPALC